MPEPDVPAAEPALSPEAAQQVPDWARSFDELDLQGMTRNLAANASAHWQDGALCLCLDADHYRLLNDRHQERIRQTLAARWDIENVRFEMGQPGETPASHQAGIAAARQQQAVDAIRQDPVVQRIVDEFNGRVLEDSIRPL